MPLVLTMREKVQARAAALHREFEAGQAELDQLERRRTYLRETILRISGAVQVLEELLEATQLPGRAGDDAATAPLAPVPRGGLGG